MQTENYNYLARFYLFISDKQILQNKVLYTLKEGQDIVTIEYALISSKFDSYKLVGRSHPRS